MNDINPELVSGVSWYSIDEDTYMFELVGEEDEALQLEMRRFIDPIFADEYGEQLCELYHATNLH